MQSDISPVFAKTCRVLIVEDVEADAGRLKEMLTGVAAVRWQARLEEALECVNTDEIDLVLLDLTLPGCHGIDAFTKLQSAAPGLPVILLSDLDDEATALRTVQEGAQDYLIKRELTARTLRHAIRYALERDRVERELIHRRQFLDAVMESTTDHIYFKDTESRFIHINRPLAAFFGLKTPDDAVGKSDFDFFPRDAAQQRFNDERRLIETGKPVTDKVECQETPAGERRWVLTTKMPLRNREGKIIGTFGSSRDITAVKEMEETLSRERNLLRSTIDNVPDLIHAKDDQGRYILNNLAHTRLLKADSPQELLGKTVFDFFPSALAEQYHADDLGVIASGVPILDKIEPTLEQDGLARWISTSKVPLADSNGKITGVVTVARDITQQKRAQEALLQANADLSRSREKLMKAMKELRAVQLQLIDAEKMKLVGRLAAGVAHEVKNPLAVVQMGMEFLKAQEPDDPTTQEVIRDIMDAVKRADSVVRGLLDFSTPKSLALEPADLNGLIQRSLLLVRGEFKGGRFQVVEELEAALPPVRLDKMKMEQVFVNLFTNAAHAMEGGGMLTVRTSSRQVTGLGENISNSDTFQVGDRLVVAEVLDTGHGLPESAEGKFFEPFFTTKPTGKGTGLGLTVTKAIIDLHGGSIGIRNRPEGGACVTIMLRAETSPL